MSGFRVGLVTVTVMLVATVAWSQTSSVTGRVTSINGGVIGSADISLQAVTPAMPGMPSMAANAPAPRTAQSGGDGAFTLTQVPPGNYVLMVDKVGFGRSSQEITVPNAQPLAISLEALEIPGAEAVVAPGTPDTQTLLNTIKSLQQRVADLEASTVLSDPVTSVKRIDVWVDENGNQFDQETPGTTKEVTYQRERVYRRENINEKLEDAIAEAEERNVKIGVSAATVTQFSRRTKGDASFVNGHAYELASADLFFTAGLAQHTIFFADVVGLSGAPPDAEIPSATLLNGFAARLVRQNEINLREAWVSTELFSQRLGIVAGRLDLTNYFDHNAAANDETTQFLSDALVNNPALGLAVNGAGAAAILDPKNGFNFKVGFQQSNTDATNLSESLYTLGEVGYVARPPGLSEGTYRVWGRWNNTTDEPHKGFGVSLDQKLVPTLALFARFGSADAEGGRDRFYSGGFQVQNGWNFNPLDTWGIGYARSQTALGQKEDLVEWYYSFQLTERLRLSAHLQSFIDSGPETPKFGYVLPGVRLQADF